MDLKGVVKSAISEMSYHEKEEIFKHLVTQMFEKLDISDQVEEAFQEIAEDCIAEYLKKANTVTKIREKITELLSANLENHVKEIFEEDDDIRDDLTEALAVPIQRMSREFFDTDDAQVRIKAAITKELNSLLDNVDIDFNF